ncbi:MAG TPA: hypothetical protein VHC69_33645 [Polyangiaceae bacterium]|nr:hypothetical protein [Polyangiaceae bacterium]
MIARAILPVIALTACGTNNAGVPKDLLDAVRALNQSSESDGGESSYPPPPYGTEPGDVVQDLCFQGWMDPAKANYDPAKFTKICLSDFHADPDTRLLLIESCAIWCVACKFEYGGSGDRPSLQQQLDARKSKGFRVMGTIFQNGAGGPAAPSDAKTWASVYSLTFPFALDSDHQLGLFTSPNVAPFNLLIDTRKMQIVLALEGDEPAVLFGKVDGFLAAAGSSPAGEQ